MSLLTYQILQQQDDVTSLAVQKMLDTDAKFQSLAKAEGASLLERDRQDAVKLREGIARAVQRGLLDVEPPGKVFPIYEVDVHNKSSDTVASEILSQLPSHRMHTGGDGLLVTLQGLSGTGKGTTVQKLRHALGGSKCCVAWSNGNVFRALTWLLTQQFQRTSNTTSEFGIASGHVSPTPASPMSRAMQTNANGQTFEQFIAAPEVLTYCAKQLTFDRRCDADTNTSVSASLMCGFDVIMEIEGDVPITSPVKTLPTASIPGVVGEEGEDTIPRRENDGSSSRRILYASDVAETLLKDAVISARVPFVAGCMQGEVLQFTRHALDVLRASGVHVILEGREETLQYIATPHRFELIHSQAEQVLGKRRAAQRIMALAHEHLQSAREKMGGNHETHSATDSVAVEVLTNALNELSTDAAPATVARAPVMMKASESTERVENTGTACGCC